MPEEAATVVPVSLSDTVDASDTASRLRISVARLARLLRQPERRQPRRHPSTPPSPPSSGRARSPSGSWPRIEQIAPPSVTRIAAKLEDAGYVVRRFDGQDRRVCRLELTARRSGAGGSQSQPPPRLADGAARALPPEDLAALARASPCWSASAPRPAAKVAP